MLGDELAEVLAEAGVAHEAGLDVVERVGAEGCREADLAARGVAGEGALEPGFRFFLAQVE